MDLTRYSSKWYETNDGVWRSEAVDRISYPSEGNEVCFQLEDSSFWFQHRNRVIQSLVSRFSPKEVFFDVGGGNGCVTKCLQEHGIPAVLVEPGENGIWNAKRRKVEHVVQSMWTPDLVYSGSAAAVGLFDVVEHIEDDEQFLRGVYTTLATNGLVFITVPAFNCLWSNEDVHAGHFRRYRLPDLQTLMINVGFCIEYSSYFFGVLPLPIFLQRCIPTHIGWRKASIPQTTQREHSNAPGFTGRFLNQLLHREHVRIARLQRMWTGSSCVLVGRKA